MTRKPTVLSGLGVAAAVLFVVCMISPWGGVPKVEAAMVMQKLGEQLDENVGLEVTLEEFSADNVYIDGNVSIADGAIVGDIELTVNQEPPIRIDAGLAISNEGGWILIRELQIDDPAAQAMIALLMPPGSQTLLVFDADMVGDDIDTDGMAQGLEMFRSESFLAVIDELISSHAAYGATVENQPDGTVLVSMPIEDAEGMASLERLASKFEPLQGSKMGIAFGDDAEVMITDDATKLKAKRISIDNTPEGETVEISVSAASREGGLSGSDRGELIGSTLSVVYNPASNLVSSFGVENIAGGSGRVTMRIMDGGIDPALLDQSRVTTPSTRVLDLAALESMFSALDGLE